MANSSADRSCKPKIIRTGGIEWTTEERNLLRDNRDKTSKQMMALLPRRSQQSIISMRDKTGFTYQNPFGWNDVEDRKLRKLAETLCATDIAKVMPGRTYSSVFDRAKKLGIKLRSRTRPHVMTGDPLIDAIRKRALEDGMSVMALDRELGTKQYFSSDCLSARKRGQRGRFDKIAKAVEYFGGELTIDWKDE
ncbi:SANT/Myb-like DNA-binding domain-containing protein [Bradyrhizobium denitrificans]